MWDRIGFTINSKKRSGGHEALRTWREYLLKANFLTHTPTLITSERGLESHPAISLTPATSPAAWNIRSRINYSDPLHQTMKTRPFHHGEFDKNYPVCLSHNGAHRITETPLVTCNVPAAGRKCYIYVYSSTCYDVIILSTPSSLLGAIRDKPTAIYKDCVNSRRSR